jgi:hypothetical protein
MSFKTLIEKKEKIYHLNYHMNGKKYHFEKLTYFLVVESDSITRKMDFICFYIIKHKFS